MTKIWWLFLIMFLAYVMDFFLHAGTGKTFRCVMDLVAGSVWLADAIFYGRKRFLEKKGGRA